MKRGYLILYVLIIIAGLFTGCKKMIEIDPPIQAIIGQEIYNSNTTAASVLTGVYTDMSSSGIFTGRDGLTVKLGLSADEFVSYAHPSDILNMFYTNSLTQDDGGIWNHLYAYIFRVNAAIEGLSASKGISAGIKSQLLGEARFLRAFMYFYLVNLYGDVPLLTSTDIKINGTSSRTAKTAVYEQMVQDLKDAIAQLNENYVKADAVTVTPEKVRPNKAVATALLSRVYLYMEQWAHAEEEATKLINNTGAYLLPELDEVFLKNSSEAIWQLQPTDASLNTFEALCFVLLPGQYPAGPNPDTRPVYLSGNLFNQFQPEDNRKAVWVDSIKVAGEPDSITYPYAFKYKVWDYDQPRTEYLMVFRLAEQYLIRAEARAAQGKITGENSAMNDLNIIRNRAGLSDTAASDAQIAAALILNERRLELFSEWGHRWLDLKRTQNIDEVMTSYTIEKNSEWSAYKALYPIPVDELRNNPALRGHQNPGYPQNF